MADNTTLNLGVGGDVARLVDVGGGGVKTQVVKIDVNATTETLLSATNPMPVRITDATTSLEVAVLGSAEKTSAIQIAGSDGTNALTPYMTIAEVGTGYLNARVLMPCTGVATNATVGVTDTTPIASNVARKSLTITNLGTAIIYFQPNVAATTTAGHPVLPNGGSFTLTTAEAIHTISGTAGQDVRFYEETRT
jgi:hypothetical protein